jgi:hypothetical protein
MRQCEGQREPWRAETERDIPAFDLVEENIYTIKKNTAVLLGASKEFGREVNLGKTKYILMSRSQKIGQNVA